MIKQWIVPLLLLIILLEFVIIYQTQGQYGRRVYEWFLGMDKNVEVKHDFTCPKCDERLFANYSMDSGVTIDRSPKREMNMSIDDIKSVRKEFDIENGDGKDV